MPNFIRHRFNLGSAEKDAGVIASYEICGAVFTASCDIEPAGCAVAWLLLLLSAIVHVMHYCVGGR